MRSDGVFDNAFVSARLLRGFWAAHKDMLFTLPIQQPKLLEKYEGFLARFRDSWRRVRSVSGRDKQSFIATRALVEEDDNFPDEDTLDQPVLRDFDFDSMQMTSLGDLVRMGVAFRDLSGSVIMDLIEELKEIESVPVLLAIDQYNCWEGPSAYYFNNKVVTAEDMCVSKALKPISKRKAITSEWKMKNGLAICALSFKHPQGLKNNYADVVAALPVLIRVPVYSQTEFLAAIKYYVHQKRIDSNITTQEIVAYRSFTGSVPALVRKDSTSYFLTLNMDKFTGDFYDISGTKTEFATEDVDVPGGDQDVDPDDE